MTESATHPGCPSGCPFPSRTWLRSLPSDGHEIPLDAANERATAARRRLACSPGHSDEWLIYKRAQDGVPSSDTPHMNAAFHLASRASLVLLLALVLSAPEAQAVTRVSCRHACVRFAAHCVGTVSLSRRCQQILPRLGVCRERFADFVCRLPSGGTFPATGQTTCWGSTGVIPCPGTGQDGDIQAGAALAYTDNGDGTITDDNTGLMWEKLSDDGSIHDKDTNYTWDNAFAAKVADLNSGTFGGYTDWRLPNVKELQSIVNYENVNPSVSPAFDTGCTAGCTVTTCSCTASLVYWSSSTFAYGASGAWGLTFSDGTVFPVSKTARTCVRAVRGGS